MDYFNGRYARLSAQIQKQIEDARFGGKPDPADVAGLWTACNDAADTSSWVTPPCASPNPPQRQKRERQKSFVEEGLDEVPGRGQCEQEAAWHREDGRELECAADCGQERVQECCT